MEHNIHRWFCGGGGEEAPIPYKYSYDFTTSNITGNTYKCIWTPEKIVFYIDNVDKKTFFNNGEDWFPYQAVKVIVSQQITQPYNSNAQEINPVCPQTSYFDYVRVKKFFLAPEITISSDPICTTGTAIIDVAPDATNITWSLSPTNLFSGSTSGTGENASFSVNSGGGGAHKI